MNNWEYFRSIDCNIRFLISIGNGTLMHLVTICSVAVPWLEPLLILLVWFTQHVIKSPYPNLSPSPLHYPMPLNGGDLAIPLRPSKILPSKLEFYLFLKVSISDMTNACIVYVVIMESGCKITIFYLKMVLKRGLFIYFEIPLCWK